jgi:hypothetical protein
MTQEVKSPEKSLSYIAWSVKEMAESLKTMAKVMTEYMSQVSKNEDRLVNLIQRPKQDEIPF